MLTLTSRHKTWAHRLPAGLKLGLLAISTLVLMALPSLTANLIFAAAVIGLYLSLGWRFSLEALAHLRILWPFLLIIALWHGFTGDYAQGGIIAARLCSAVALANLVTMTTPLSAMMRLSERLSAPLAPLGLTPQRLGMAFALVLRFTPVFIERAQSLVCAWRARSSRRPSPKLMTPLLLLALDDAEHVAEALRARGGI